MEIYNVAIIPLITALIELAKKLGLPEKFAGLFSAILGVIIGVIYIAPENILEGLLVGLVLGLAACGLYSAPKNTVQGIKGQK